MRADYFTENSVGAFIETLIACTLVFLLSYFTIYRRVHNPLSVRYQLPFLVIIAAFFCVNIQSFFGIELMVLDTAVLSVEFFSHVFAWVTVVSAVQKLAVPPLRLIGAANLFHAGVWFLWELLGSFSALYSNIALSVVCYILIAITALTASTINGFHLRNRAPTMKNTNQLLLDGELPFARGVSSSDIVSGLKSRCGALGKYYGLTTREIDVLVLIAQGRSHTRIEEELTLSVSTIKTHISNIFSKMKVHSRQEIIDLVFEKPESEVE